ncbi:MAG: hypothetical protein HYX71_01955 [Opitutae bacterium]|nr:hypothetical protein [Opitutae bacterium]
MTFGLAQPPEYLHALLNHLPILGLAVALLALGSALLSKHRAAIAGSLLLVGLLAASAWPVIASGASAYDRIRVISDPEGAALLKRHMVLAERWAWLYYVTAAIALAGAILAWKRPKWQNGAAITVALFAASALAGGAAAAKLGGQVRHAEFRPGSALVPHDVPAAHHLRHDARH